MLAFNIKYFAGISNLCSNNHLSDAFTQANNALEYIHLFSSGNICRYSETPTESQIGYLDLKNTDYIINIVMSANQQYLDEYFHNIYNELAKKRLSTEDAKSCLYFFYNVSMRLKVCLLYQHPYSSTENFFILDKNFFDHPLLEGISITEKLYLQVMQFIKEQKAIGINKKASEVSQYIEANYFDINLNLNSISSHFSVSPSYLSKKFKDEYGISIIDYLYKTRISNSLKLISNTSLKISDIAQMVGFQDSNAYIRIFKAYQGCTPGKYKNSVT
jgi:YesN/AraC family two-component response regulator